MWAMPVESVGGVQNETPKHLFSIAIADGKQLRAGFPVAPEARRAVNFRHFAFFNKLKAMFQHIITPVFRKD